MRLTFSNFNFTFVSQFETLGLQGEAAYYFAGNVQASVRCPHRTTAKLAGPSLLLQPWLVGLWLGQERERGWFHLTLSVLVLHRRSWGARAAVATTAAAAPAEARRPACATAAMAVRTAAICHMALLHLM